MVTKWRFEHKLFFFNSENVSLIKFFYLANTQMHFLGMTASQSDVLESTFIPRAGVKFNSACPPLSILSDLNF